VAFRSDQNFLCVHRCFDLQSALTWTIRLTNQRPGQGRLDDKLIASRMNLTLSRELSLDFFLSFT
jgi:hypothetical protein